MYRDTIQKFHQQRYCPKNKDRKTPLWTNSINFENTGDLEDGYQISQIAQSSQFERCMGLDKFEKQEEISQHSYRSRKSFSAKNANFAKSERSENCSQYEKYNQKRQLENSQNFGKFEKFEKSPELKHSKKIRPKQKQGNCISFNFRTWPALPQLIQFRNLRQPLAVPEQLQKQ